MKELLAKMEVQTKAIDCLSTQSKSSDIKSKYHSDLDKSNKAA